MLTIYVGPFTVKDDDTGEDVNFPKIKLRLEHSLISIAKWESKWKKPFLCDHKEFEKTNTEILDYIRCMTVGEEQPMIVYAMIETADLQRINEYIKDSQTATTFHDTRDDRKINKGYDTNETIYYSMFKLGIPLECEKWHINRLLTLIRVYGVKDDPDNKMSDRESLEYQRKLNQERRAATKAAKAKLKK